MASEKEKQSTKSSTKDSGNKDSKAHNEHRQHSEARESGRNEKSQAKTNRQNKGGESKLEPGKSGRTTDHNTIRRWVEERGGQPATVKATEGKSDPGLLRIDFPGRSGEGRLEPISWEDFFDKFEEKKLAFLYQEETRTGRQSRFSKFVSRGNEDKK